MKTLDSVTTIERYVAAFSNDLAEKVRQHCEPLHIPTPDNRAWPMKYMATKLFDRQQDAVTGAVKALQRTGLATLACQMGTGKTPQAIATVHCHALRGVSEKLASSSIPCYRACVLCPPHLVKKWRSELYKFLGDKIKVTIILKWDQFIELRYQNRQPEGPEWYIMAMTTAKLGYDKRCAAITKRLKVKTDTGTELIEGQVCPRCNYPAYSRTGKLATRKQIEDGWMTCCGKWCRSCGKSYRHDWKVCPNAKCQTELVECGEALWQANSRKVSPVQYVKAKGIRWFDYYLRDEAHESKSDCSIDGHTNACFSQHAKYTLLLTGTLLAGKSDDIRPLLFREIPKAFLDLGYGWNDEIPFAERYGRIQTVIRTTEGGGGTRRRQGKGSSKSTNRSIKPGIMPQLFPDFVANNTIFMSLTELATNLPSYHEETRSIPMEGLMQAEYEAMRTSVMATFRSLYVRDRKTASKLLGPMLEAFMTWPDVPYDRKAIGFVDEAGNYHKIYEPPDLDRTMIYPKERVLIEYLKEQKTLKRKCWIFCVRDDVRDRLQGILESHGFRVAALTTKVAPIDRIEWIAKHGPSCDVGLSHPKLVETGIELFGPGYNFPTLLWYSTGFMLNTLRQASRRSWRIGQPEACKTVYLYYGDSAQHTAIGVMASKLVAAEAIEGKFSDGGLADESVDEDIALAVARAMADNIKVEVKTKFSTVEASASEQDKQLMMRKKLLANAARLRAIRTANQFERC